MSKTSPHRFDLFVDIPTELRSGSLKRTHAAVYSDGRSSWNITVDIWTMLLPTIQVRATRVRFELGQNRKGIKTVAGIK